MKLTIDEVRKIKKERTRSYFDMVSNSELNISYNKSIKQAKEDVVDLINAYNDPTHRNHKAAYNAIKSASFNMEQLEDDRINKALLRNQAKKMECINLAYEGKILDAIPVGYAVTELDRRTIDSWKSYIKDKWHACGYESFSDVDATEDFLNFYPLSFADRAIENIANLVNSYFPDTANKRKAAGFRSRDEILNLTKEELKKGKKHLSPDGETEIEKSRRLDKKEPSRYLNEMSGFAVVVNKMAVLNSESTK